MGYQVLARKWRPRNFDQVIGQKFALEILKLSISNNRIAQAYLFTGTRGVGKTSLARIFAKSLRCESIEESYNPCLKCFSCLEIENENSLNYFEIDGASNNSVENIREIIENAKYLPTNGKYKIYVIDEVHMLSQSAFNALLKTLEEPPAHVVFILATTDPQKIPLTVLSRCQRIDFKNVSQNELLAHLEFITKEEKIEFENRNILTKLVRKADGSVRDSLSLMEQVLTLSQNGVITDQLLSNALGFVEDSYLNQIIVGLLDSDKEKVVKLFNHLIDLNIDLKNLCLDLLYKLYEVITHYKDNNVEEVKEVYNNSTVIKTINLPELIWIYEVLNKDLTWAIKSLHPVLSIELILTKVTLRRDILAPSAEKKTLKTRSDLNSQEINYLNSQSIDQEISRSNSIQNQNLNLKPKVIDKIDKEEWKKFIAYLFKQNGALAANLERGSVFKNDENVTFVKNLKIYFKAEDEIFFEYIFNKSNQEKLLLLMESYFNINKSEMALQVVKLDTKEKSEVKITSYVEELEEEETLKNKAKEEGIKNNLYIKEAVKLFNTQIKDIILHETKK